MTLINNGNTRDEHREILIITVDTRAERTKPPTPLEGWRSVASKVKASYLLCGLKIFNDSFTLFIYWFL